MRKLAILTSSRADYGIYRPLLRQLALDTEIETELVVFGTHLSRYHGYTLDDIVADGFQPSLCIDCMALGDSEEAVSSAMGTTVIRFTNYWSKAQSEIGLAVCLGDRFEMFSAVAASIPFNIPIAHIHGGETSLGAIDETYRHSLTHMSTVHFASTQEYANRVGALKGSMDNVHHVGALSLDNLESIEFYSDEGFIEKFGFLVDSRTVLVTLHPETRTEGRSDEHADVVAKVLERMSDWKVVITMPNADTDGTLIRRRFQLLHDHGGERISVVENMGTRGYFTALRNCGFVLGNSSSGILEAASFSKRVINVGVRQQGRICGENVTHVPFDVNKLEKAAREISGMPERRFENPYYAGGAAERIVNELKHFLK